MIFFLLYVYIFIVKCNYDFSSIIVIVFIDRSKYDNFVFVLIGYEGMIIIVIIYYMVWDCYFVEVVFEKCLIYWFVLESVVLVCVFL